jgi:hypothetical protein
MNFGSRSLNSGLLLAAAVALAAATVYPLHTAESPAGSASIDMRKALNPKRVSFYQVPLVCPAAPHIGCGSASKPLLLELESNAVV